MTDIVERLRKFEASESLDSYDFKEAADEIELLRNLLHAAQQHNMDLAEQLRAVNAAAAELPLATSVEAFSGTFNDIKKAIKERSNVE